MSNRKAANCPKSSISVSANFVSVFGVGILLQGEPGSGKSETSLALLQAGHQLIADDVSEIFIRNKQLFAKRPELDQSFLVLRDIGMINVEKIFGPSAVLAEKDLQLIIQLNTGPAIQGQDMELIQGCYSLTTLLGLEIPSLKLHNSQQRPIASLVEVAAKQHLLQLAGYSAYDDFKKQHKRIMRAQTS